MSEGELDKSEQPTQFKLQQARRKGQVARGMDLGFLIALVVLLLYLRVTGADFAGSVAAGKLDRQSLGGTLARIMLLEAKGDGEAASRIRDIALATPVGTSGKTLLQALTDMNRNSKP